MLSACRTLVKLRGSINAQCLERIVAPGAAASGWLGNKEKPSLADIWRFGEHTRGIATTPQKKLEEQVSMLRSSSDFAALKSVLDLFTNAQLTEVEKVDFMTSFDTKYKGLAALFWEKVHEHISKRIHLIMEDGLPPETFNLSGEEDMLDLLSINASSGLKSAVNPGDVLRHFKELEDDRTYTLVWGIMTQAKKLGI
ncbi:hypothetical protein BSKO_06892 [Bryopsis sp. KO-2023]|nr:hypothetical protein BSKO_06892 [Bryopsis sp. KO-2023]